MKSKVITAEQAAAMLEDSKTISTEGFVGAGMANEIFFEIEKRFNETGKPANMNLIYSAGQGDKGTGCLNMLAHEGLITSVIGGHYNQAPMLQELAMSGKAEAYNLPQGVVAEMFRDMAAHRPTVSKVGLHTFCDPRMGGGKINDRTTKDRAELVEIGGEEYIRYIPYDGIDYALLRGTYADEKGNISMSHECCICGVLPIAMAAKNSGGKVFVQVEKVVKNGSLNPRDVVIPGIFVDYIVPVSDMKFHHQTVNFEYHPALSGEIKIPLDDPELQPMSIRKIIGRRCAMELTANSVVNLGIGMPEEVSGVAAEEGISDLMTLTVEAGPIGGVPLSGMDFGAAYNPEAIIDSAALFDFYDGGGIDEAFLGLAECDRHGNINVSKFGPRLAGAGGFINITQNAKKVVFCGTFTAKGLKVAVENEQLKVLNEGSVRKFVGDVQHITFSGSFAQKRAQKVLYVTERAVFTLTAKGLTLTEIAPGIDLKTQVLDLIDFDVMVADDLKTMDARIFRDEPMGLVLE